MQPVFASTECDSVGERTKAAVTRGYTPSALAGERKKNKKTKVRQLECSCHNYDAEVIVQEQIQKQHVWKHHYHI